MVDTFNSGTFLPIYTKRSGSAPAVDGGDGHNHPKEIMALYKLEAHVRSTGKLHGGDTVVQAFGKNFSKVTAWINPADTQPIKVIVQHRKTRWAIAPNTDATELNWMLLSEGGKLPERRHAAEVNRIIRSVFSFQSPQNN